MHVSGDDNAMTAKAFAKKYKLSRRDACMSCVHAVHINEGVYYCLNQLITEGSSYVNGSSVCDLFEREDSVRDSITMEDCSE